MFVLRWLNFRVRPLPIRVAAPIRRRRHAPRLLRLTRTPPNRDHEELSSVLSCLWITVCIRSLVACGKLVNSGKRCRPRFGPRADASTPVTGASAAEIGLCPGSCHWTDHASPPTHCDEASVERSGAHRSTRPRRRILMCRCPDS